MTEPIKGFVETPQMLNDHLTILHGAKKLSNRAKASSVSYPHTIEILDAQSDRALTFTVNSGTISWSWDKAIEDGMRQIVGRSLLAKLANVSGFTEPITLRT